MIDVRDAYRAVAEQYIELFGNSARMRPDDLDVITRHLSGVVLDAGCGPGHLTAHLRSRGVDAIGIDIVPEFLRHARVLDRDGAYLFGSLLELPVADSSVDGVLAWYSAIHLGPDDLDRALREIRRVLVRGGTTIFGFFTADGVAEFDHQVATAYAWPVDEVAERLHHHGLSEIERLVRAGVPEPGRRPHAVIAAITR